MKMKQYKSHKIVEAEPMTAGYFWGKFTPDDLEIDSDGFCIIGIGREGEDIWITKEEFEKDYSEWNNFEFDEPDVCETCSS